MKYIYITFMLLIFCSKAQAQTFQWATQIGSNYTDRALCVMVDNQGNTYVGGHYNDTVDFDPGPGSHIAINKPSSLGGGEAYVLKLNASDNFSKVLTFGSPSSTIATCAMAKDAAGNLFLSGYFASTADFDPDTSSNNVKATGSSDAFLLKLDANEQFQWVKHWAYNCDAGASNTLEEGAAMAVDPSGNFCFAGRYKNTVDLDPGTGVFSFTSKGEEGYILKLDTDGNFLWARRLAKDSIADFVFPHSISTDAAGNMYIAGDFNGTVDFNPDTTVANKLSSTVLMGFVLKLDAGGNFQWVKQVGGMDDPNGSYNHANAVAADAAGNVYVAGSFMSTITLGSTTLVSAGFSDIFVAKLDATGNFQWAKGMGSTWDSDMAERITLDGAGNIYVTGIFRGTVDFDAGGSVSYVAANGSIDVFILKLGTNGNFISAKGFGGSDHRERIYGLALKQNSIYTVGKFTGQINCDPNGSYYLTSDYIGTTNKYSDAFIHKMGQFPAGIRDLQGGLEAAIFPNPATNHFTIDLSASGLRSADVSLFDMQGRKVLETHMDRVIANVNVASLPKGVYLVKVQGQESYGIKKLVIE